MQRLRPEHQSMVQQRVTKTPTQLDILRSVVTSETESTALVLPIKEHPQLFAEPGAT